MGLSLQSGRGVREDKAWDKTSKKHLQAERGGEACKGGAARKVGGDIQPGEGRVMGTQKSTSRREGSCVNGGKKSGESGFGAGRTELAFGEEEV